MTVQNGVQPRRLSPVQSSDEAKKATGADTSSKTVILLSRVPSKLSKDGWCMLESALRPMTTNENATSPQNGTDRAGAWELKSAANLTSRRAETAQATATNGLRSLALAEYWRSMSTKIA